MNPGPWRVVWKPSALEGDVARATLAAIQRGENAPAIADAMEQAERELIRNPDTLGESRPYSERVFRVEPLTIWFSVHEDERLVYVHRVVYAPPRRR